MDRWVKEEDKWKNGHNMRANKELKSKQFKLQKRFSLNYLRTFVSSNMNALPTRAQRHK